MNKLKRNNHILTPFPSLFLISYFLVIWGSISVLIFVKPSARICQIPTWKPHHTKIKPTRNKNQWLDCKQATITNVKNILYYSIFFNNMCFTYYSSFLRLSFLNWNVVFFGAHWYWQCLEFTQIWRTSLLLWYFVKLSWVHSL